MLLLEAAGRSAPGLVQLLVAAGVPWLVATSLQLLSPLSHSLVPVCLPVASPLLIRAPAIGFRAHVVNPG